MEPDFSLLASLVPKSPNKPEESAVAKRDYSIVLPAVMGGILAFAMNIIVPNNRSDLLHVTLSSLILACFLALANIFLCH